MSAKDVLIGAVTGIGLVLAMGLANGLADATAASAPINPRVALYESIANDPTTPDCAWEDGSELLDSTEDSCRWDAGTAGNGIGESFVVLAVTDELEPTGRGLIYIYSDGRIEL